MDVLTTRAGEKAGREVSDSRVLQLLLRLVADLAIIHTMLVFTVMQSARVLGLAKFLPRFQTRAYKTR